MRRPPLPRGYFRRYRKIHHRLKTRVYRYYAVTIGVEAATARPKQRNADGPGYRCFPISLSDVLAWRRWRYKKCGY